MRIISLYLCMVALAVFAVPASAGSYSSISGHISADSGASGFLAQTMQYGGFGGVSLSGDFDGVTVAELSGSTSGEGIVLLGSVDVSGFSAGSAHAFQGYGTAIATTQTASGASSSVSGLYGSAGSFSNAAGSAFAADF